MPTTITPGAGFGGATAQPAAVGSAGDGFDCRAMAAWTSIPQQTRSGTATYGVIATHKNGIDYVRFIANGGTPVDVSTPTLNPDTGLTEYCVQVDTSALTDGDVVELRAIAYPLTRGEPRVLQGAVMGSQTDADVYRQRNGIRSEWFTANNGDTLQDREYWVDAASGSSGNTGEVGSPFATIWEAMREATDTDGSIDGLTIYCQAGTYDFASGAGTVVQNTRWVTITKADGVAEADVKIKGGFAGGFGSGVKLARLYQVTNDGTAGGPRTTNWGTGKHLWYDDCDSIGTDRFSSESSFGGPTQLWTMIWGSNLLSQKRQSGLRSFTHLLNCTIREVSNTPIGADAMVFNVVVHDFERNPSGTHADVIHGYFEDGAKTVENRIIFNLRATDWTLLGILYNPRSGGVQRIDGMVFVQCHFEGTSSQWRIDAKHLIFDGCWFDSSLIFSTHPEDDSGQLVVEDCVIRNSVIGRITGDATSLPDIQIDNCHFFADDLSGTYIPGSGVTNLTRGSIDGGTSSNELLADGVGSEDIGPLLGSVIDDRVTAFPWVTDVLGNDAGDLPVDTDGALGAAWGSAVAAESFVAESPVVTAAGKLELTTTFATGTVTDETPTITLTDSGDVAHSMSLESQDGTTLTLVAANSLIRGEVYDIDIQAGALEDGNDVPVRAFQAQGVTNNSTQTSIEVQDDSTPITEYDFGTVPDESSQSVALTVNALNGQTVTISSVTAPNGFSVTTDPAGLEVSSGTPRDMVVELDTSVSGKKAGSLVINHDGQDSPLVVPLAAQVGAGSDLAGKVSGLAGFIFAIDSTRTDDMTIVSDEVTSLTAVGADGFVFDDQSGGPDLIADGYEGSGGDLPVLRFGSSGTVLTLDGSDLLPAISASDDGWMIVALVGVGGSGVIAVMTHDSGSTPWRLRMLSGDLAFYNGSSDTATTPPAIGVLAVIAIVKDSNGVTFYNHTNRSSGDLVAEAGTVSIPVGDFSQLAVGAFGSGSTGINTDMMLFAAGEGVPSAAALGPVLEDVYDTIAGGVLGGGGVLGCRTQGPRCCRRSGSATTAPV